MTNLSVRIFIGTALVCMVATSYGQSPRIAPDAQSAKPLSVGAKAPEGVLLDLHGNKVTLSSLYRDKPVILVFYRGSWCPFCTRHTQQLIKAYPQIKEQGYELVGISPDAPEVSMQHVEENAIPFPIYSDSDVDVISGFGLAFRVDDPTLQRYKGMGIDLKKASGHSHNALPVPAVYIIGTDGIVRFAHSDPDYRKRLEVEKILAAIR
ncbi:MAG: peroxiredoxin [Pirellulaceae bacterium]|nr:MAG: peroxiredoxin [Pirellulaceae bacterium]